MFTARAALLLACAGAFTLAGCSKTAASSTTAPSVTPADATIIENFASPLAVGGGVFYSFSIAQYGNVAVTLTDIIGSNLPDALTLSVGVGRPSGTSCTATSVSAVPGSSPQVTGAYGPGVFCVRIYDGGTLVGPVTIKATVAHS